MPAPEVKSAVLSSIREQNKVFYGMVVAQAQKVDVDAGAIVFTFAPVHKGANRGAILHFTSCLLVIRDG